MKNILVTGAAGFVGSMLCETLHERGHTLIPLARTSGHYVAGRECDVVDVSDPLALRLAFKEVECVIHLAGRAHVMRESASDPLAAFRSANRDLALTVARVAMECGVKKFIFVSSIGVNGSHTTAMGSFSEESDPEPQAPYAVSKLEAECALQNLLIGGDMCLVIVRPPLVYAGHAPGNFKRLLRLVAAGVPLPFAEVNNRRSMISLGNLVDFLALCVQHPAAANQLFVIADGHETSTTEIVKYLAAGMGQRTFLFKIPTSVMQWSTRLLGKQALYNQLYGSLVVDIRKARQTLGWCAPVNVEQALFEAGSRYKFDLAKRN